MNKLEEAMRKAMEKKLGKEAKPWLDEKVVIVMPDRKDKKDV